MAKDFYIASARRQLQSLQSARAQTLAELEAHKQNRDKDSAAESVQRLADLASAEQNVQRLVGEYMRSQQPPPPVSPEERAARPIDRMDWQDVVDMARQSKYGKNIQANDPGLLAGWQEVQRRRQRGE